MMLLIGVQIFVHFKVNTYWGENDILLVVSVVSEIFLNFVHFKNENVFVMFGNKHLEAFRGDKR